jgi:hypothetical protein
MVQKLTIENLDRNDWISCQFNPTELSITKSNHWNPKMHAGSSKSKVDFVSEGLHTIQISLVFDTYELDNEVPVTTLTDRILQLMRSDVTDSGATSQSDHNRPPHLQLQWGPMDWMRVVLLDCNAKYTLFTSSGVPVRATLQLKFQEIPEPGRNLGQNPTSRASGARRARTIRPGDTLDWIAAEELGSPGAWRSIAVANGIDDPRRLRVGQSLVIPTDA